MLSGNEAENSCVREDIRNVLMYPASPSVIHCSKNMHVHLSKLSTRMFFTTSSGEWNYYGPQSFNLIDLDGNSVTISPLDIQVWMYYSGVQSVAYGVVIGLCSTLLIAMIALNTPHDCARLRRPIFLLNI